MEFMRAKKIYMENKHKFCVFFETDIYYLNLLKRNI